MANEAWTELIDTREDYQLAVVDTSYLTAAVKPKQFLHIDQSECILCEGCVDICPWKCIHYLSIDAIAEASNVDDPNEDEENVGFFVVDEDACTRCQLCIDRCPTGVITLGKFAGSVADEAADFSSKPWESTPANEISRTGTPTASAGKGRDKTGKQLANGNGRRAQGEASRSRRAHPGQPGLGEHLPARIAVQEGLHRQPSQPLLRDHEQRALSPPPGEGEASRSPAVLHPLSWWPELLPLHLADHHRHLLDVLLPANRAGRLRRHPGPINDVAFGHW